jgi:hypothetical protein
MAPSPDQIATAKKAIEDRMRLLESRTLATERTRVYRWKAETERTMEAVGAEHLARQLHSADGIFAPDRFRNEDSHIRTVEECRLILAGALEDLATDPGAVLNPPAGVKPPTVSAEGAFFAGQHYDALRPAGGIFVSASQSLDIIDNYPGPDLLDQLTARAAGVHIRLMGSIKDASFPPLAKAFCAQHGRLEVRRSSVYHDRFVFVDGATCYHFGASLKDLGKKGFMFSRIEESRVVADILTQFEKEWQAASLVAP